MSCAFGFVYHALKVGIDFNLCAQTSDSPLWFGFRFEAGSSCFVFGFVDLLDELLLKDGVLEKIACVLSAIVIGDSLKVAGVRFFEFG